MRPFRTPHKRWLLSFTSLPTGREESEGAGCGIPFFRSLLAFHTPVPLIQAPPPQAPPVRASARNGYSCGRITDLMSLKAIIAEYASLIFDNG